MHFVYVLLSGKDQKYYIGYTDDVEGRIKKHNHGSVPSTKHRRPLELIYYESYQDKRDALGREAFLKSGSGHRYLEKQLKHYFNRKCGARIMSPSVPSRDTAISEI